MEDDPIVAEIHRIREERSARVGHDVDAFLADMRKREAELGDRLVRDRKDRRAKPAEADGRRNAG